MENRHCKRKHCHFVKCEKILAPWVPQQLNSTKLCFPLLSASLKLLFAFFLFDKQRQNKHSRLVRQPRSVYQNNIQAAAGAEASGTHSLCTASCLTFSLPSTRTLTFTPWEHHPKIDRLTHANISPPRACMLTLCTWIVCAHNTHTHWHSLYISLFTSSITLSLVPDVFQSSTLLWGCLTLSPDIYESHYQTH